MGSFVGSFLNVVIHRLPRNESVVHPPSRCYSCGTGVRPGDNIPILSWLLLRGRCRFCRAPFSVRYLVGELTVAVLTGLVVYAVFVARWIPPPVWMRSAGVDDLWARCLVTAALLAMLWWLWVCAVIDYDHSIIPDELTKPWQVLAPALAVCTPLPLGMWMPELWTLVPWFVAEDGLNTHAAPWAGLRAVLWVAVPALCLLALSVPAARWIYTACCPPDQRWRAEDHRGFAIGVWWFLGASVVHLAALAALAAWAGAAGLRGGPELWLTITAAQAVLGSLAGWMALYLVGLAGTVAFRRNAMGFGDVKFLAPIGALLAPPGVLLTFVFGAVIGTAVGIPMRLLGRGREIPFGPFLAAGAVATVIVGPEVLRWVLAGAIASG